MEVVGGIASVITIYEFSQRLNAIRSKFKTALPVFQGYCDELQSLAYCEHVLNDILEKLNKARELTVKEKGEKLGFLKAVSSSLEKVRAQAHDTLKDFGVQLRKGTGYREKAKEFRQKLKKSFNFVLREGEIPTRLQAVEHAKSTLQLAMCTANLHLTASDTSGQEIQKLLLEMKGQILQQSEALEALHKSYQLQRRDDGLQSSQEQASMGAEENSTLSQGSSAQDPLAQNLLVSDGLALSNLTGSLGSMIDLVDGIDMVPADAEGGNTSQVISPENHKTCFDVFCSQEKASTKGKNVEERRDDNSLVDSTAELEIGAESTNPQISCQAYDGSDEEWEGSAQSDAESFLDFLATAPGTAARLDSQLCALELRHPSKAFIAEGVNLKKGKVPETGKIFFCVERLVVTDDLQTFCLRDPCPHPQLCSHITLKSLDDGPIRQRPPCKIPLELREDLESIDDGSERASERENYSLVSIERCQGQAGCTHTLLENYDSNSPRCAVPVKYLASFNNGDSETSETESNGESAHSERGDNDYEETDNIEKKQFPHGPASEDDKDAFSILRSVLLEESEYIPATITLDTLIQFLLLVCKYQVGDAPIAQARRWVESLRPITSGRFDERATTWLWIFWKLDMKSEFKVLSQIVQQQAEGPIDQSNDRYPVSLPQHLLDRIAEKRLSALSKNQGVGGRATRDLQDGLRAFVHTGRHPHPR